MPGRRAGLSGDDRALWAAFAGTIRALPGRAVMQPQPPPPPPPPGLAGAPAEAVLPSPPRRASARTGDPGLLVIGAAGGADKTAWRRLSGGQQAVGRRLDLHGHTVQHAHRRFEQALLQASAQGVRCMEVITGRGTGTEGGILRREFPLWLNLPHLRPLILAATHPHQANTGSVLLLLRRPR